MKLLCSNLQFANIFVTVLKVDSFDSQAHRILFSIISDYVLNYNRELDQNNLMILAEEHVTQRGYSSEVYAMLKDEIKTIFKTSISSEDFIKDKLTDFVRNKAFKNSILESIEIINSGGSYEKALKLIDNAISVGDSGNRGFWFEDFINLPEMYKKYYDPTSLISSGFMDYDKALGGGMAPGELHVIVGPPKSGKSTMAVNIGSNVLLRGKTVYHISLELKEQDVAMKYACRMTGMTSYDILYGSTPVYYERMKEFDSLKQNLYISYFSMHTVNAMNLRSWVSQIRAKTGKSPDIIIVDYDDLLNPVGESKSLYEDSGGVYSDLIGVGDYFKCPILTMSQPKREAWYIYDDINNPQLITMQHLANSAMKAFHCTSISTLNFKKGSDEGILNVDVSRRGESKTEIKIRKDYSRSLVKQIYV